MTLRGTTLLPLGFVLALAATLIAGARKEASAPGLISAVPYTVVTPGTYWLADDLCYKQGSGSAIIVMADDVTIDLGGHRLWSEAGPGSRTVGISSSQCSALTICNGMVEGFHFGLQLSGVNCNDNHIYNVTLARNWYIGLWVEGRHSLVMNNRVENTGGCQITGFTTPIGMRVVGEKCAVINNHVTGFLWRPGLTQEVVGLAIDEAPGAVVTGNTISQDQYVKNSWGIWVNSFANDGSTSVDVENNSFVNFEYGCAFIYARGRMKNNCYRNVATRWQVPEWNRDADQGGNASLPIECPFYDHDVVPAAGPSLVSHVD